MRSTQGPLCVSPPPQSRAVRREGCHPQAQKRSDDASEAWRGQAPRAPTFTIEVGDARSRLVPSLATPRVPSGDPDGLALARCARRASRHGLGPQRRGDASGSHLGLVRITSGKTVASVDARSTAVGGAGGLEALRGFSDRCGTQPTGAALYYDHGNHV
jgi:hypothetical protein